MIGTKTLRRAAVVAAAAPVLGLGVPAVAASAATYTQANGSQSAEAGPNGASTTSSITYTSSRAGHGGDGATYTHRTLTVKSWAGPSGAGTTSHWSRTYASSRCGCGHHGWGHYRHGDHEGDGYHDGLLGGL